MKNFVLEVDIRLSNGYTGDVKHLGTFRAIIQGSTGGDGYYDARAVFNNGNYLFLQGGDQLSFSATVRPENVKVDDDA